MGTTKVGALRIDTDERVTLVGTPSTAVLTEPVNGYRITVCATPNADGGFIYTLMESYLTDAPQPLLGVVPLPITQSVNDPTVALRVLQVWFSGVWWLLQATRGEVTA